jgi:tetratricopeptide (TPR) repeat protein
MIGEPVKSLCESRHALASNPHDATAWELSGVATQSLGESYLPEAVEAYNQALARDDQNPDTWSNFAAALYDLERHHEALDAINRALQLDDSMSYRWNLHGDILTWLGDKASASVSYARAFEIDKRMVDAWNIKVGPSTLQ